MYRRSHEIRPSEHGVSPAGSFINIFGIKEVVGEAKRAPLLKKYSMCESALGDREGSQTPLAFSARAVSKRKSSFLAEYVETPNKVKLSRYGNAPHLESEESQQLKEARGEIQRLRKDFEEVKNQNQLILEHLKESKRAFENLNGAYESKCEQTETLKSIVNSIKEHIFKEEKGPTPLSPLSVNQQQANKFSTTAHNVTYTKSIIQNKPKQNKVACRRRVSIQQTPIIMNADELDDMQETVRAKIEHYTKMKIVQSIKGSTYDIYSQGMI